MTERKRNKTEVFWSAVGGRKQMNGYIFAVLISVYVFSLKGTFAEYAMWLAADLLGTSLAVAHEDKANPAGRSFPSRRAGDPLPPANEGHQ